MERPPAPLSRDIVFVTALTAAVLTVPCWIGAPSFAALLVLGGRSSFDASRGVRARIVVAAAEALVVSLLARSLALSTATPLVAPVIAGLGFFALGFLELGFFEFGFFELRRSHRTRAAAASTLALTLGLSSLAMPALAMLAVVTLGVFAFFLIVLRRETDQPAVEGPAALLLALGVVLVLVPTVAHRPATLPSADESCAVPPPSGACVLAEGASLVVGGPAGLVLHRADARTIEARVSDGGGAGAVTLTRAWRPAEQVVAMTRGLDDGVGASVVVLTEGGARSVSFDLDGTRTDDTTAERLEARSSAPACLLLLLWCLVHALGARRDDARVRSLEWLLVAGTALALGVAL